MSATTVSPTDGHRHLHDALWVDAERFRWAVAGLTPTDRTGRRGRLAALARWYGEYRVQLQAHHWVEDRVWFPAIAARSPEFVARDESGLADDHRYLDALMTKVDAALGRLADPAAPFEQARFDAESGVAALANLLADHFAQEEHTTIPLIAEICRPDLVVDLGRRADRKHSLRELRFLLPWFVDHLSPTERTQVLREARHGLRVLHRLTRPRYRRLVAAAGLVDRSPRFESGVRRAETTASP